MDPPNGATALRGPGPPHYRGFTITLRHITLGRTPLDEGPVRRRDLYLTTRNTHKRQTSMPPAGFEPTMLASKRPQTHALDLAATGIGGILDSKRIPHVEAQTGSRQFTWCGRDCSYLARLQRRVTRSSPRASKSDERVPRLEGIQVRPSAQGCGLCNILQYTISIRIATAALCYLSNAFYANLHPSLVLSSLV
jgi:hypothetical protein